jgi:hypothetical protein
MAQPSTAVMTCEACSFCVSAVINCMKTDIQVRTAKMYTRRQAFHYRTSGTRQRTLSSPANCLNYPSAIAGINLPPALCIIQNQECTYL